METAKERLTPAPFALDWGRMRKGTQGLGVDKGASPELRQAIHTRGALREWVSWLCTPGAQALAKSRGWL